MDEDAQPDARRAFKAEFILTLAILAMCVVIAALTLLLWREDRLHAQEEAVVARVRAARAEVMAMAQAQGDAEALASRYLATRQPALLSEIALAQDEARDRAVAVRTIIGADTELADQIAHLSALMEERFTQLDAETNRRAPARNGERISSHVVFRLESAALFTALNVRIDAARQAENDARGQLNFLSGALGLLALIASILAIFALRRERDQWRLAHALAEDARAKAAASDLSKTRFLAVASHDMRQPLHALMLYVSALERRVQTDEARDILSKMDRATRSMSGMFSSLLDLARIQSGVFKAEIVDFPLQDVLDRIAAESPEGAFDAPATQLSLRSDPSLIERILRNLVANAIKHGGGKARIEIATHGDEVEITVADDGPGIAIEDQKRIFDEFVRLEGRGEGLGLGLTIVKHLGDLLGRPVTLQSEPGHGARFSMRAPLAPTTLAAAPSAASSATLAGVATLIVDDEPLAREAVAGVLRDLAAQVRACANEAEADDALAEGFRPALILMDFRIDGELRGLDIARRLCAKLTPPPAVVVVTGDTEQETLAKLRASGFAWLIKPVDPQTLIETAATQLRGELSVT